ncbi:uncharacterized protein [Symphalangus syndactylus]|uniref:uncharacterized protein n=1 Tax=Symphalangus syndactylus TaxID=9590 RepID=UPI0030040627
MVQGKGLYRCHICYCPHPAVFPPLDLLDDSSNSEGRNTFHSHVNSSFRESCCKEDQSFQRCSPEDQVSTDVQHRGASSISQPSISHGHKTPYSPVTRKVNSAKASRRLSSVSSPSFSERRCSLFVGFQKRNASPYWQQSRANFDSEEDTSFTDLKSSSDHFGSFMSRRRRFLSRKLSIVSYYNSANSFDPQASGQNVFNLNEIEIFSKISSNTDAKKHNHLCS